MARSDYAHWNEDADYMWWQEEGRHIEEPPEQDDDYDYANDPGEWCDEHEQYDCGEDHEGDISDERNDAAHGTGPFDDEPEADPGKYGLRP